MCANLKSLLETGHVLPRAPWEMHADLRATQMARHDIALQLPLKVIAGPLQHCQGEKESPPWCRSSPTRRRWTSGCSSAGGLSAALWFRAAAGMLVTNMLVTNAGR